MKDSSSPSFDAESFLSTLPHRPGVYRMLGENAEVIYVGKAANLRKRVSSYFKASHSNPKTAVMLAQLTGIDVTVTGSEGEALLLENNLIKSHRPRYNVLYRDDKSYPYIYLSSHQEFPRLGFYRGARSEAGRYFGPYPSAGAVRDTLSTLQKVFPVRQCEDSFFRNRSRPCLQYQIKRCTGPCVGLVDAETYAEDVRHVAMFLEGKSGQVIDELVARMEHAAQELHYELAARYRDQIGALRRIQERQYISTESGDLDIIAAHTASGLGCVQVFFVRSGRNLGNKTFFPRGAGATDAGTLLSAFLAQYYLAAEGTRARHDIPDDVILSHCPDDLDVLTNVLANQAGRRIKLSCHVRGARARYLELAIANARHALGARLSARATVVQRLEALQDALNLDEPPQRIECFDVSHTMGESPVASCVVFDSGGPVKSDYRRFNIKNVAPGDDYAAMHQALSRRYRRLKEGEGRLPDLLLIDGGRGQLAQAERALEELQVTGVVVVGVAKGPTRKPGLEALCLSAQQGTRILAADSPALHLIQQIRDEAHRFAITGHRQRRAKSRQRSVLEDVPGLGVKRRQLLLRQFGGLQEVARAGVEDIASVPGISRQLAQRIYDTLHGETP
jgi:excinuclease ABC subunit C